MKVRYCGEIPEHSSYLTSGKWYEFDVVDDKDADAGLIAADHGEEVFIRLSGCAHLNFEPWEVCE